jgi:hypothetical protein
MLVKTYGSAVLGIEFRMITIQANIGLVYTENDILMK